MMRLNVPLYLDGTVDFHACLLAIVRTQVLLLIGVWWLCVWCLVVEAAALSRRLG